MPSVKLHAFMLVAVSTATEPVTSAAEQVAITDVTVIDPTVATAEAARLPGRTVLVVDGRIDRVGPAGAVTVPAGYRILDGRGGFLLPGFWDMHVHFNRDSATAFQVMGPLMVAHGVTSVRDLMSDCWEPCAPGRKTLADLRAWQSAIAGGALLAPRFQALSSSIVHGPVGASGYPRESPDYWQPRTMDEGRKLARFLARRGVDVIKVYSTIPPAAFAGLVAEAKTLGLPVTGHMPWSIHPIEVARLGMRSIEHARWPVMACNAAFESFRAMYQRTVTGEAPFDPGVFEAYKAAVTDGYERARCAAIVDALAAHHLAVIPTHVTREMDARAADSAYRADPRRRFVPAARLRGWDRDLERTASQAADMQAFYRRVFADGLQVTGMAHAAGVTILVGTDAFDTMVFPGPSYHDELAHLGHAGLPPLAILRAATYDAAVYSGKAAEFGTVQTGKVADLVLLDRDPLLDIGNAEAIRAVVFRGQAFDRATLDAMILGVELFVAEGTPTPFGGR